MHEGCVPTQPRDGFRRTSGCGDPGPAPSACAEWAGPSQAEADVIPSCIRFRVDIFFFSDSGVFYRPEYMHVNTRAQSRLFSLRNKSALLWPFAQTGLNKQPCSSTRVFSTGDSKRLLGVGVGVGVGGRRLTNASCRPQEPRTPGPPWRATHRSGLVLSPLGRVVGPRRPGRCSCFPPGRVEQAPAGAGRGGGWKAGSEASVFRNETRWAS